VAVGHGQTRRGWAVVACSGYSRAGAGVLVFSTQTEDLLAGIAGCLERLGGLPRTLVWDRQAGIHGHGGRPSEAFAAFRGQLKLDWRFCEPADPQAKGVVERLQATWRPISSRAAGSPTSLTSKISSMAGGQGERAHAQDSAGPARRPARRGARGDGGAAAADARHSPTLDDARPARSAPAL